MEVIISAEFTKRKIEGPFEMCIDRATAQVMFDALQDVLSKKREDNDVHEFTYGWVKVIERVVNGQYNTTTITQHNGLDNTPPKKWNH